MVTGRKPAARHPGATDAKPAAAVGFLVAAVVVAASVYGITRFDPGAFGPHAAGEAGGAHSGAEATTERD